MLVLLTIIITLSVKYTTYVLIVSSQGILLQ